MTIFRSLYVNFQKIKKIVFQRNWFVWKGTMFGMVFNIIIWCSSLLRSKNQFLVKKFWSILLYTQTSPLEFPQLGNFPWYFVFTSSIYLFLDETSLTVSRIYIAQNLRNFFDLWIFTLLTLVETCENLNRDDRFNRNCSSESQTAYKHWRFCL
jgi:hypothetical protein